MKLLKYSLLISLMFVLAYCSPDNNGSYGEAVNRTEDILGTWSIESVSQIDLDAEKKSFPDYATKVDITNAISGMPYSDFVLQIDNSAVTTTLGNSPMQFVIQEGTGTWSWVTTDVLNLVNSELGINASSAITTVINNNEVMLSLKTYSGITGEEPKLSLNFERLDADGNAVTRYEYVFAKQ